MSGPGFRAVDGPIEPADWVTVQVDGRATQLPSGSSVLAALLQHAGRAGETTAQAPDWFCAIGQCQRCRVRINGREAIACQVQVQAGDVIDTQESWSG